jgi:methyltransferase
MNDRPFLAVSVALGLMRLMELRHSRRNERLTGVERIAGADAAAYPLMAALHLALFLLPLFEPRRAPPQRVLGGALLALATALRLCCIRSLGTAWNVRSAVAADLNVVDAGPYRFIRHPNYLAVAIEFAALPLFGGAIRSAIILSLANALILARRIRAEEAVLLELDEYRRKMAGKARFLPGVF